MQIEKNADKLVKTLRVFIVDQPGYLGKLCTAIGEVGGNIGDVKTVAMGLVRNTRDITFSGWWTRSVPWRGSSWPR
jgi:malate dehydrogenase (oxaloacetate-decarboxylating)